jgi:hypothetical protein
MPCLGGIRGALALPALVFAFVSCTGSSVTGTPTSLKDAASPAPSGDDASSLFDSGAIGPDGGTGDGGPGSVGPFNCAPGSPMPATLAGTWDVQGSSGSSSPTSATLVIDGSHFSYGATHGDSLAFTAQAGGPLLVWHAPPDNPVTIGTTYATASLQQGVIPLPIGGQWTFAGSDHGTLCQAAIGAPQLTASCTGTHGFPNPLPSSIDGAIRGVRTSTAASLFGDLGGTWHISDVGGGSGSCDATFTANTFSVTCDNAGEWTGLATVTFCDGIAAGTTSSGVEFSAHRQ